MSSRRPMRVADAAPSSKVNTGKKTPLFMYLFPLFPILFMLFMSGKEKPEAGMESFSPPGGAARPADNMQMQQQQGYRHKPPQQQVLRAAAIQVAKQQQVEPEPAVQVAKQQLEQQQKLQILKQEELISAPNTIVTAYFTLKSKFAKEEYIKWMSNMLSLQDAMVIFTSPEMVDTMWLLRSHAKNRTVIIPMDLSQLELVQKHDDSFWEAQLDKDPEKRIHRSYQLFWIWLSKSFFVKTAIGLNVFDSEIFMWSDIGCFRNGRYRDKEMILQKHLIPKDRIFQMAHHEPQAPPYIWWNDKYTQKTLFYHSGSQMIGYKDTWLTFHDEFMTTVQGFIDRDMFIGEDQTVLQSTCLRVTSLCAYVPMTQVSDNHYFGLRFVLHYGGDKFKYWYPPEGLPVERADVQDKSLLEPMKEPPPPGKDKIRAA